MLTTSPFSPMAARAASFADAQSVRADHRESPVPGEHPLPDNPSPDAPPTPSDPPVVPPSPVA